MAHNKEPVAEIHLQEFQNKETLPRLRQSCEKIADLRSFSGKIYEDRCNSPIAPILPFNRNSDFKGKHQIIYPNLGHRSEKQVHNKITGGLGLLCTATKRTPGSLSIEKGFNSSNKLARLERDPQQLKRVRVSESQSGFCPICYQLFSDDCVGIDCCLHQFCYPCLQEWTKITNVCPLCKKEFVEMLVMEKGQLARKEKVQPKKQIVEEIEDTDDEIVRNAENYCYFCDGQRNKNYLLICDYCNLKCCHTYCLDPPLDFVPQDEWYCDYCVDAFNLESNHPTSNLFSKRRLFVKKPHHQPKNRLNRDNSVRLRSQIVAEHRKRANARNQERSSRDGNQPQRGHRNLDCGPVNNRGQLVSSNNDYCIGKRGRNLCNQAQNLPVRNSSVAENRIYDFNKERRRRRKMPNNVDFLNESKHSDIFKCDIPDLDTRNLEKLKTSKEKCEVPRKHFTLRVKSARNLSVDSDFNPPVKGRLQKKDFESSSGEFRPRVSLRSRSRKEKLLLNHYQLEVKRSHSMIVSETSKTNQSLYKQSLSRHLRINRGQVEPRLKPTTNEANQKSPNAQEEFIVPYDRRSLSSLVSKGSCRSERRRVPANSLASKYNVREKLFGTKAQSKNRK